MDILDNLKLTEVVPVSALIEGVLCMHTHTGDPLFGDLNHKYWEVCNNSDNKCSFCGDFAKYHSQYFNETLTFYACQSCYLQIKDEEVDILNPEDDPVSLKFRQVICGWIDEYYYYYLDEDDFHEYSEDYLEYYDKLAIWKTLCSICQEPLTKSKSEYFNSAVLIHINNKCHLMHVGCYEKSPSIVKEFFDEEDYQEILRHIVPEFEKALGL